MCIDIHTWFQDIFLRHAPQRHALMLAPSQHQKYHEEPTAITPHHINGHLAGNITLATPAAANNVSCLLPLDVDRGGHAAITALLTAATAQGLWAFGQYCPRPDWVDADQRGYVWLVFDQLTNAARLQQLGRTLIHQAQLDPRTVEARAHHAVTRLPFGKHTHINAFGILMLPDGSEVCIDHDLDAALTTLQAALQENSVMHVPELEALPVTAPPPLPNRSHTAPTTSTSDTDVIQHYNQQTDIRALVEHYTGMRDSYTLYHCPCGQHKNDDHHASLGIVRARTDRYGAWMVKGYTEWCAFYKATDAFGVYCHCEGITAKDAVKRLAEAMGLTHQHSRERVTRTSAPLPITEDEQRRPHHPPVTPPPSRAAVAQAIREATIVRLGQDTTLRPAERAIAVYLITECAVHHSDWCKRSLAAISRTIGVVRRTVQMALRQLETKHYIKTDHTGNIGHGGDEPNLYTLLGGGRSGRSPIVKLDHDSESDHDLKLGRGGNYSTPERAAPTTHPDRETPPTNHMRTEQPPQAASPPQRTRVWAPPESLAWLDDVGTDLATLETAAATAKREARRLFAQKKTNEGKKRMWQANQITDRITQLIL